MKKYLETQDKLNPYSKWLYVAAFLIALMPSIGSPYIALMVLGINIIVQFITIQQNKEFICMTKIKEEIIVSNLKLTIVIGCLALIMGGICGFAIDHLRNNYGYRYSPSYFAIAINITRDFMQLICVMIGLFSLKFVVETLLIDLVTANNKRFYTNPLVMMDITIMLLLFTTLAAGEYNIIPVFEKMILILLVAYGIIKYYQNRTKLNVSRSIEKTYFYILTAVFLTIVCQELFRFDVNTSILQLVMLVISFMIYLIIIKVLEYALSNLIDFENITISAKVIYPIALLALVYTIGMFDYVSLLMDGLLGIIKLILELTFVAILGVITFKKFPLKNYKRR